MLRQRKWRAALMVALALVALLAIVFQKQIRIAYHKNRLCVALRYFELGNSGSVNVSPPPPPPSGLEKVALIFGRGNGGKEMERMNYHAEALVRLGYLVREKIPLKNRLYGGGTNQTRFYQLTVERFAFGKEAALTNDWWDMSGTVSNQIVITTTTNLLPRWRKLVEDFDQP